MTNENGHRFPALKEKQRAIRDGFPGDLGLRVHRALSSLQRAEMAGDDHDAAFIFYWIAFNAAYADELRNKFVFQPFWRYQNAPGHQGWEAAFERSKRRVGHALTQKDTQTILSIVFDRLYVLRNQLVHGGATWNSRVNREQVRDGSRILAVLVPEFIDLMMDNPDEAWGAPYYPVVE
jgi:hypothetical protein